MIAEEGAQIGLDNNKPSQERDPPPQRLAELVGND